MNNKISAILYWKEVGYSKEEFLTQVISTGMTQDQLEKLGKNTKGFERKDYLIINVNIKRN